MHDERPTPRQGPDRSVLRAGSGFDDLAALRRHHQLRAPEHWSYRPVSVEIELTQRCNLRCTGCAIIDEVEQGYDGWPADRILSTLAELEPLGFYSYNLTGGEPFLKLDDLCRIVAASPLDIHKIQTNAALFSSVERAERMLGALDQAGFVSRNRWLRPAINCSIGMQTDHGAPLRAVACFTLAFLRVFGDRADFSLNALVEEPVLVKDLLAALDLEYRRLTRTPFPFPKVYLVRHFEYEHTPRLAELGLLVDRTETARQRIDALPKGHACFNFELDSDTSPLPRILIRTDGRLYPCSCFGHAASPGSIRQAPVRELLERVNRDQGLLTVQQGGLSALLDRAERLRPGIGDRPLPASLSLCKVCKSLRDGSGLSPSG